jgi:hypothetical protein
MCRRQRPPHKGTQSSTRHRLSTKRSQPTQAGRRPACESACVVLRCVLQGSQIRGRGRGPEIGARRPVLGPAGGPVGRATSRDDVWTRAHLSTHSLTGTADGYGLPPAFVGGRAMYLGDTRGIPRAASQSTRWEEKTRSEADVCVCVSYTGSGSAGQVPRSIPKGRRTACLSAATGCF